MNNDPLISIITVCFNSEKTITKTIESVLNQSYKNIEYIIIDGASTDSTLEIIKSYESRFNGKMKFTSEKDQGIYDAMNKGIEKTNGEIIGIINSDDWYEQGCFTKIARLYKENKMQIIYGYQRLIKEEKEYDVILKSHEFIRERMINHPTCFISKAIYSKYGMYDLKYKISADYEFMLRMNKYEDIEYLKVCDIISNFRLGGESSSQNGVIETAKIRYKYGCISKNRYYNIVGRCKIHNMYKKLIRVNSGKK